MTSNQRIRNKVLSAAGEGFALQYWKKKLEKEIKKTNFLDLKVIRSEILYDETRLNFLSECRSGSTECKLYIKITPLLWTYFIV